MGRTIDRITGYKMTEKGSSLVPVLVCFDTEGKESLHLKFDGITICVFYEELLPIIEEARNHEEGL